jgi:malic enzyme
MATGAPCSDGSWSHLESPGLVITRLRAWHPVLPRLPDAENLREMSAAVAAAVYHSAVEDGVATKKHHNLEAILNTMWEPEYRAEEEI